MDITGYSRVGARIREHVIEASAIAPLALTIPVFPERDRLLPQLLIFNILLQIFDGVATYNGVQFGVREANPLLRYLFGLWGLGPTLLVFKVYACALLLLVYRGAGEQLARNALIVLAAVYSVCSFIPWLAVFLRLLVRFH